MPTPAPVMVWPRRSTATLLASVLMQEAVAVRSFVTTYLPAAVIVYGHAEIGVGDAASAGVAATPRARIGTIPSQYFAVPSMISSHDFALSCLARIGSSRRLVTSKDRNGPRMQAARKTDPSNLINIIVCGQ